MTVPADTDSFALHPEAVHLWICPLTASEEAVEKCRSILSPDEKERALRFRLKGLADCFTLRRAALRLLLGSYTGTSAEDIPFQYGLFRKPELSGEHAGLRFNASESAGLAAFSFALGCELGVDVQEQRSIDDASDLAKRFFTPEEYLELSQLPPEKLQDGFFACWTRKEAYIKFLGLGLSKPLHEFRVSTDPDVSDGVYEAQSEHPLPDLHLHSFFVASNFRGALAYRGHKRDVITRTTSVDTLLQRHLSSKPPFVS